MNATPPIPLAASTLPPVPGQAAIVLGFLQGTWALVDGFHRLITGDFIRFHGQLGPWAAWTGALGLNPMRFGLVLVAFGALWMLVGNLYLFQNRRSSWSAMVVLVVLSSWYLGWVTLFLVAQLILLLLPSTRAGLCG